MALQDNRIAHGVAVQWACPHCDVNA